jgi:type I restriction enzyme R subunit
LEQLKAAVRAQLEKMIALNRTRANFADKFEELIEAYNAGSATIEATYAELLALTRLLSVEQMRHIQEGFSEEELVIFDILTRPAPELSAEEKGEVKKVARALLGKMKRLLVLNWRDKSAARARLQAEIRQALDDGLPRAYTPELYQAKCAAVFEYVYDSYPEPNRGVYAQG